VTFLTCSCQRHGVRIPHGPWGCLGLAGTLLRLVRGHIRVSRVALIVVEPLWYRVPAIYCCSGKPGKRVGTQRLHDNTIRDRWPVLLGADARN
jgi:hypothetical protein